MQHAACYKKGYPRPRFVRESYVCLNGEWNFMFDDENVGEKHKYYNDFSGFEKSVKINVPFAYQSEASGVDDKTDHSYMWYSRRFDYSLARGKRLIINFDGADYLAKVWLNGVFIGSHTGGYARFSFDITNYLKRGENLLVVKCEDEFSPVMPRGKQRYVEKNISCFYTPTSGIWKTVWLEETADVYLKNVISSCEYENCRANFEFYLNKFVKGASLQIEASYQGEKVSCTETEIFADYGRATVDLTLFNKVLVMKPWSIGRPEQFFDLQFTLKVNGKAVDKAGSYTALVDYRTKNDGIEVNYLPCYYFRMVLDQGYFPRGGMTAESDEELLNDVLLIKQAGFNGVRLHQKIEDERFYYFCDMVGLFFWLEMPAAYDFTSAAAAELSRQWSEIVLQHKGYLSLMAYVPVNESWGVLQTSENIAMQNFTAGLYRLTKALDSTRPVISNDGWEHTESDIVTLHNYAQTGKEIVEAYGDMQAFLNGDFVKDRHSRAAFANGYKYGGQPIIISEYGGVSFIKDSSDGWGYGNAAKSEEEFINRLYELTRAIESVNCQGYCLTQFTDVMQEKNGLFTEDRKPKADIAKLRLINGFK
jgi:glycoside hydrolase family 2 sugar binding protein